MWVAPHTEVVVLDVAKGLFDREAARVELDDARSTRSVRLVAMHQAAFMPFWCLSTTPGMLVFFPVVNTSRSILAWPLTGTHLLAGIVRLATVTWMSWGKRIASD